MGICGALGKMNWTSSNLFRRRQFSASQILWCWHQCCRGVYGVCWASYQPAPLLECQCILRDETMFMGKTVPVTQAMGDYDGGSVPLERGDNQRCRA